ncbi:hypothetical protein HYG77_36910 (plasmid) [Rhodococcus sp. ZPP]|uniref:hypothetical protein n=1 Tax=unclassified Rhodococcus (in: high G+C Gram-positive bacteria) TaxID=192944 RepID=UPI001320363D|nr:MULTISPECIES: hypothetical protein [unclassified Rhodococcus (in: high G+C Gram-positive bacteria)]QHE74069.1 hypothetical protein GFS60_07757 [Rhodococcus sp. WAY2]QTJ71062.1 hypothetical protein HYG77_36910 [Rhodococcus sp. ZPP]
MNPRKIFLVPTTDHEQIRTWIQKHRGAPAKSLHMAAPGRRGATVLRIDFVGLRPGPELEHITWGEWFALFDEHRLAFCFPVTEDGTDFQLISRATTTDPPRTERSE